MKHRQPLAQYFAPRLSAERAARVWARVARTLPPQRRRWSRPAWRLAIATIAALAVLLTLATAAHDPMDGTVVETGAGQGQLVHLPDGSQLALVAFTRLRLEQVGMHDVRLALEAGALEARVTHVAGRSFVLRAGDVEIRVVGTRFTASRDALGAVEVRVDEGRVTVAEGHGPDRFVEAGQTWQSTLAEAPPVPADETVEGEATGPARAASSAAARTVTGSRPPRVPAEVQELYLQDRYTDAYDALGPGGPGSYLAAASPQELMTIAEVARLSGHPAGAALAVDALRTRHRRDSRAAIGALELARLRLNDLDDPAGAVEAFDDAIALGLPRPLRDDALARRVEAIAKTGDRAGCRVARDRYFVEYPEGAHVAGVSRMCQ